MKDRLDRIRENLPADFGCALISTRVPRSYACNFEAENGNLILTADEAYFHIDGRYSEMAKQQCPSLTVVREEHELNQISERLSQLGVKRLHVEDQLTVARYRRFKEAFSGIELDSSVLSDAILASRMIKEPGELDNIKSAQKITDEAFSYICSYIKEGMTELEIAAELEIWMRRRGADERAFATIAASGENSSKPHAVPGERRVKRGDLLTLDFGAMKNGYCSDMTRTVALGEIDGAKKKLYETVLAAQKAALAAIKGGLRGCDVDAVARKVITGAGYPSFGHGLGHSLGLEIHESPRYSPMYESPVSAGTVMTVEPGIYLEGLYGVRIEDMVYVTPDGCENLTSSPKELIVLAI